MSENNNLSSCIFPISVEDYFKSYFGKKFLHVSREDKEYFDSIISKESVDAYLRKSNLSPSVRVVQSGDHFDFKKWTSLDNNIRRPLPLHILDSYKLLKLYEKGASFVIDEMERFDEKLALFCNNLIDEFGCKVDSSVFVTPPNASGFEAHSDPVDVLVIQAFGSKIWRLYGDLHESSDNESESEQIIDEINLRQGDCLYIPKGLKHACTTVANPSIHLSLRIYAKKWSDFGQVLFEHINADGEFDQLIPNGKYSKAEYETFKKNFIRTLSERLKTINLDDVLLDFDVSKLNFKNNIQKSQFCDLIELDYLSLNSIVQASGIFKFQLKENEIRLVTSHADLSYPIFLKSILSQLLSGQQIQLKEVKGLIKDEAKLALAKSLISEGILSIVNQTD